MSVYAFGTVEDAGVKNIRNTYDNSYNQKDFVLFSDENMFEEDGSIGFDLITDEKIYPKVCPFDCWTNYNIMQSEQEGWILTNDSYDCVTISKYDENTRFSTDVEAENFVRNQAKNNDQTSLLALELLGKKIIEPMNFPVHGFSWM
jgi:hypothetical protein